MKTASIFVLGLLATGVANYLAFGFTLGDQLTPSYLLHLAATMIWAYVVVQLVSQPISLKGALKLLATCVIVSLVDSMINAVASQWGKTAFEQIRDQGLLAVVVHKTIYGIWGICLFAPFLKKDGTETTAAA